MISALIALSLLPAETIQVYVVSYFPTKNGRIDVAVTGDVDRPLGEISAKTEKLTKEACAALEKGSTFRGYKVQNPPSLRYEVVGSKDFYEPIPLRAPLNAEPPLPDYRKIMEVIGVEKLVETQGVDEIWIWGYHGKIGLWESNMSSPTGDVSNSNRDPNDLPIYSRTYTVYHYNYGRGLGEMLENHMHQFEHLWNHVDGRESTPPERWNTLLFWGRFVGSDASHKIVTKPARCGWTHYAPNSESDYDWDNRKFVETDIEDWKPEGGGKTILINSDRWNRDPIQWRIYWMQAIPGIGHELSYRSKRLRNWWSFVAEWDRAKKEGWTLVEN